jgi:hypothetical protein
MEACHVVQPRAVVHSLRPLRILTGCLSEWKAFFPRISDAFTTMGCKICEAVLSEGKKKGRVFPLVDLVMWKGFPIADIAVFDVAQQSRAAPGAWANKPVSISLTMPQWACKDWTISSPRKTGIAHCHKALHETYSSDTVF